MRSQYSNEPDEDRSLLASRLIPVILALVGVLVSGKLGLDLREAETRKAQAAFELEANARISLVRTGVLANLELLHSMAALFASSEDVEPEEFRTFSAPSFDRFQALRAIIKVGQEDPGTRYAVEYREGPEATTLPLDLGTQPELAAALRGCSEPGKIVVSRAVTSIVPDSSPRVLGAIAVHDRYGQAQGLVGVWLDVEELIDPAFGEHPESTIHATDVTEVRSTPLTGASAGSSADSSAGSSRQVESPEEATLEATLEVGGRQWRIACLAVPGYIESRTTWTPWGAFVLGLFATALFTGAVVILMGRAQIHRLVERRTREVQEAYGTLAAEAEERLIAVSMTQQLERHLFEIINLSESMIYIKDWYGRYLLANKATARAYGTTLKALSASRDVDQNADVTEPDETLKEERELMTKGMSSVVQAVPFVDAKGARRILRSVKVPCVFGKADRALLCVATDITEQKHATDILENQNRILRELAEGAPSDKVLRGLVGAAEEIVLGMRCSILRLDEDGCTLRHSSAPSLPAFYNEAIDGLQIGPAVGSCGAAASRGERVVVEDVMTHANWEPYRELAARAKIRACWSEPIRSAGGQILGTFAMYYAEPRRPEPYEEELIKSMACLAGIAIERGQGAVRA